MNTPADTIATKANIPSADLQTFLTAISHVTRWKMMGELSLGEPREIAEMAHVGGCSYDMALKHLAVLRDAGIVVQGRGRLYQIPRQFLPEPGQRVADFGHCRLRFEAAN